MVSGSSKGYNTQPNNRTIQSVDRALYLLGLLGEEGGGCSLNDLVSATNLHKSTVHRMLASLQGAGLVEKDAATGTYQLGLELVALTGTVLGRLEVVRIAEPHLRRLADETQETVNLAIRHKSDILNVKQIPGPRVHQSFDWIGKRSPLHKGAAAKALLAHLKEGEIKTYLRFAAEQSDNFNGEQLKEELREIRRRGAAINFRELDPNVIAVGAPVFNMAGMPCASISIAGACEDFDEAKIEELVGKVIEVGEMLSRQLGYQTTRIAWMA